MVADSFRIFNHIFHNPLSNPVGDQYTTFSQFLGIALNIAIGTSFSVSVIAIIMSGIQFIMSQGDPKAIDTARRYLTWSVVAVILSISALTIKVIILGLLGSQEGGLLNATPGF